MHIIDEVNYKSNNGAFNAEEVFRQGEVGRPGLRGMMALQHPGTPPPSLLERASLHEWGLQERDNWRGGGLLL